MTNQSANQTNPSTMPYHWRMYMLINHNKSTGHHFFSEGAKRWFYSRVQTTPPYCGRVFVTSEKSAWNAPRNYTVRCIRPDGGINTIGEFQGFETRQSAHRFAEKYAAENFERVGNVSRKKS